MCEEHSRALDALVLEYEGIVDHVYGIYLDGTRGFRLVHEEMKESQEKALRLFSRDTNGPSTIEEMDERTIFYGKGDPNDPDSVVLHAVTQGRLKERNRPGGSNSLFLANVCIVTLYQYWEDHYRKKIAQALGEKTESLLVPVFGDLRLLRRSIIHYQGYGLPDIDRCEVLQWFKPGEQIRINQDQMEDVVRKIKAALHELARQIQR